MLNIHKTSFYKQIDITGRVDGASPQQLIQLLYEGALKAIAECRGAMRQGDIAAKGALTTKAVNIIGGLRDSLSYEVESDLPHQLDSLYVYMQRRLMEAHSSNNEALLDEVQELLATIKSGWDNMPS